MKRAVRPVSAIFESFSPADTERLAVCFAALSGGGDVLSLSGPIGSGKTFFVRALAKAMGASKLPASASFSIMREYRLKGKLRLYHFDLLLVA